MPEPLRAGDADRSTTTFSDQARFVAFDGTVLSRPKETADFNRSPFAGHLKGSSLTLRPLSMTPLADGMVLVASQGGITVNGASRGDLIGESFQTFVLSKTQAGFEPPRVSRRLQTVRGRSHGEDISKVCA